MEIASFKLTARRQVRDTDKSGHIRHYTKVMNRYVAFIGGVIAFIGVVSLVRTLGKNPDETLWLRVTIPVEAQDLRRFGKIVLLIGFLILLVSLILP
jgi:hypothetical protein